MAALRFIGRLIRQVGRNDLQNHAAEMAYFAMMAVFPFFLVLTAMIAFLPVPNLFDDIMGLLTEVAPPDVIELLRGTIRTVTTRQNVELLSATLLVCIWMSTGAMASTTRGLNKTFGLRDPRRYIRFFGLTLFMTFLLGLLIITAVFSILLGPVLQAEVSAWADLGWFGDMIFALLRYVVAFLFLLLAVGGIYWMCPAVSRRFRLFSVGTIFAALGWVVVSYGFQFYLRHFGQYDKIYGSLGAVVLTLFWFYLMSFVLLVGGQIDAMRHPELKARTDEAGNPLPRPFPGRLILGSLAGIAILFLLVRWLVSPDFFTPSAHKIGGEIGTAIEKSIESGTEPLTHEDWKILLQRHVDAGGLVDYEGFRTDRPALDAYIKRLEGVDISSLSKNGLHAFAINLHNAALIRLIVDHPGIRTVKDIPNAGITNVVTIEKEELSLNDIEHRIIRPFFPDPRNHFALARGSRDSPAPAREAFEAGRLETQLEETTRGFLSAAVTVDGEFVQVPVLLQRYVSDFRDETGSLAPFLLRYIDNETARKILEQRGDEAITFMTADGRLDAKQ